MYSKKLQALIAKARKSPAYWAEKLALGFLEGVTRVMEERGLSQKDLADRTGKSQAQISKILSGPSNLTLRTISEIAVALESEVVLRFAPPKAAVLDFHEGGVPNEFVTASPPPAPHSERPKLQLVNQRVIAANDIQYCTEKTAA